MKYSGVDPGRTTGYADFENGVPKTMGEIKVTSENMFDFFDWLNDRQDIQVLVVEGYRNRPVAMTQGHANTWSDNLESQIIGACRLFCYEHGIELVSQDPSIKPVGYGMAGLKYMKGKAGQHKQDAIAHASYWWRNTGCKR